MARPLLAIAIILWMCAFPATPQRLTMSLKSLRSLSPAQRKAMLEEGARKEGEMIWYTSMSLTDFPKIVGAFEKAVPYVKVRANRLSQSSVMPRSTPKREPGSSP